MATTISQALMLDADGRLVKAVHAYEAAIAEGNALVEHYLNLMVLYCESLDPGVAVGQDIVTAFLSFAYQRLNELPHEIETRFGISYEAIFWCEYAEWLHISGKADEKRWLVWVESGLTTVPLICLEEAARSGQFAAQLEMLRNCTFAVATNRARLIANRLEHLLLPPLN